MAPDHTIDKLLRLFGAAFAGVLLGAVPVPSSAQRALDTGRAIYVAACAHCHGSDGRGAPPTLLGFTDPPLPDLTDCSYATREAAQDWYAVVHAGGPARAFSRRMPAFGSALTPDQIERVVDYVRHICSDRTWPRGELNLPRALYTEKAFPEDEAVLTGGVTRRRGARAWDANLIYERRVGARGQLELVLPFGSLEQAGGRMSPVKLGDMAVAFKRVLFHGGEKTILSAQAEAILPTGSRSSGIGSGALVLEPGLLFGLGLGSSGFFQAQIGTGISTDRSKAEHEAFWRGAAGVSLVKGFGRPITPMVEIQGVRELTRGAVVEWDLVPQLQVTITRRQHILASVGFRLPMNDRTGRPPELLAYLIWDWYDGGLFEGWR